MSARFVWALAVLGVSLAACGLTEKVPQVDLQAGESQPSRDAGAGDSETDPDAGTGLPCDVTSLLQKNCASCHSVAHPATPMALVTYDDLVAPAAMDSSKKVYELALARMNDTSRPMPPSAPLDADAIAVFAAWANAGAPATECGVADASVPPRADAGLPECVLNSDCPGTLICRAGTCDVECITDKDCIPTWSCVETRCHPPSSSEPLDAGAQ